MVEELRYEEALFDLDVPLSTIIEKQKIPKYLYKYQTFYYENGTENQYWRKNLKGEFHLSLAKDFEDSNDCRPDVSEERIIKNIENIYKQNNTADCKVLCNEGLKDAIEKIIYNYKNKIRIGCFTISHDNIELWNKYSNFEKGYCVEYNTDKNRLLKESILPILYTNHNSYDISEGIAHAVVLQKIKEHKKYNCEEMFLKFNELYEKIYKNAYIPLFIKNQNWEFEKEYRVFLLERRSSKNGDIIMKDFMDDNGNIDLSLAIKTIYLGKRFDENPQCKELYAEVKQIARKGNIEIVQK